MAEGGAGYIVIGDVNPIRSFSPTPRLYEDSRIESFRELAAGESVTVLPTMKEDFEAHNVTIHTGTKVEEITSTGVRAVSADGELKIDRNFVVMVIGAKPNTFDTSAYEAAGIPVTFIDNCNKEASDISHAVRDGYDTACAI